MLASRLSKAQLKQLQRAKEERARARERTKRRRQRQKQSRRLTAQERAALREERRRLEEEALQGLKGEERRAARAEFRAAAEAERQAARAARREARAAEREERAARRQRRLEREAAREERRAAREAAAEEAEEVGPVETEVVLSRREAFQAALAEANALPTRAERVAARQELRAQRTAEREARATRRAERRAEREARRERRARREERRARREERQAAAEMADEGVEAAVDDAESVLDEVESDLEVELDREEAELDAADEADKGPPPEREVGVPGPPKEDAGKVMFGDPVGDDDDTDEDKGPTIRDRPGRPGRKPPKVRPEGFRDISRRRQRVLNRVVRPAFQATRDLNQIARDVNRRNPGAITPAMQRALEQLARERPRTGRTYFPPQNANPTVIRPYVARFAPPRRPYPQYVNWADSRNIAQVRGWAPRGGVRLPRAVRVATDTQGFMHEVVDQLGCGSCWVIAVASAMSDRVSIWSQQPNPQLSVTNILGCVSDDAATSRAAVEGAAVFSPATAGCAGGLPTGAIEMFAELGDTTAACAGYQWCESDPVCNKSQTLPPQQVVEYLNNLIPSCESMQTSCITDPDATPVTWGLRKYDSGRPYLLLTTPDAIRAELAANGPVVATYAVFGDFEDGTAAVVGDGWAPTRGVYCNVQQRGPKPYANTPYANAESQMIGYHAVVIVGWGVERDVPDWNNPGATLDLPYWIVRNSWGPQWNPTNVVNGVSMPGYCKIAETNYVLGINTKIFLDNADDDLIGSAVAFMPEVRRTEPPRATEPQVELQPEFTEERLEDDGVTTAAEALEFISAVATTTQSRNIVNQSRDIVNHPIFCLPNTPYIVGRANCEPRVMQRVRTALARSPTTTTVWLPVVVGCVVVAVAVVVLLVLRRQR